MFQWVRFGIAFGDDGKILFDEEELKMILGFNRGEDYIEVLCGTTNKVYGDYVGRLKINNNGEYFITCECCPGCPLGKFSTSISEAFFLSHAIIDLSCLKQVVCFVLI